MLNVDLSTLRGQELRQLLDTTRRRGDAAVTYEILQEMAARRERGEPEQRRGLFGPKRPSEARVIELNLGDPLEPKEEVFDDEPAHGPAHSQAPADWELDALDAAGRSEASDEDAIYLHPPAQPQFDAPPPPPKPRRRALWLSTGLAVGLVVGLALGGWAESVSRQGGGPLALAAAAPLPPTSTLTRAPAAAAQAPVDPIAVETETAPATPLPQPPPPSAAAAPIPGAIAPPAAPAAAPPTAPPAPEAAASTEVAEEAPAADAVKPAKAIQASAVQTGSRACAGQPTPADRAICETPRLQKLQKDLRQAYAEALDAHQDRDLLREHQLAWREARNTVTEPERLAQLYEQRIRKLKAATAEAIRDR